MTALFWTIIDTGVYLYKFFRDRIDQAEQPLDMPYLGCTVTANRTCFLYLPYHGLPAYFPVKTFGKKSSLMVKPAYEKALYW